MYLWAAPIKVGVLVYIVFFPGLITFHASTATACKGHQWGKIFDRKFDPANVLPQDRKNIYTNNFCFPYTLGRSRQTL